MSNLIFKDVSLGGAGVRCQVFGVRGSGVRGLGGTFRDSLDFPLQGGGTDYIYKQSVLPLLHLCFFILT